MLPINVSIDCFHNLQFVFELKKEKAHFFFAIVHVETNWLTLPLGDVISQIIFWLFFSSKNWMSFKVRWWSFSPRKVLFIPMRLALASLMYIMCLGIRSMACTSVYLFDFFFLFSSKINLWSKNLSHNIRDSVWNLFISDTFSKCSKRFNLSVWNKQVNIKNKKWRIQNQKPGKFLVNLNDGC